MRKRALIIMAMIMLVLASPLIAAEIMPFLKHTGIAGVDFKVYGHSAERKDILMTVVNANDPLDIESSTYNYRSNGYTLKATARPFGIE